MRGKKARQLRKMTNPLGTIIAMQKHKVKSSKPYMINFQRSARKAYLRSGIEGYFKLITSLGLDLDAIKAKHFKFGV